MNARTLTAMLRKQAKAAYTPYQWRKYTTSEERNALAKSGANIVRGLDPAILSMAIGGPISMVAGYLGGLVTPSYDSDDAMKIGNDKNFSKKSYIPGYYAYHHAKLLRYFLKLRKKVTEQVAAEQAKKQNSGNS